MRAFARVRTRACPFSIQPRVCARHERPYPPCAHIPCALEGGPCLSRVHTRIFRAHARAGDA
eukprot:3634416-Pleurochrysis_carterae.AAC.1